MYNREYLLNGLRENLDTSIVEFAKEILAWPDEKDKSELMLLRFSDIFNITSINTQDECLREMIKPKNLNKGLLKEPGLLIGEIENILKCDRSILTSTLNSLGMKGGMGGWEIESKGERRGKRYWLKKKEE